jgi:putative tryptophan/tyrosine transport system substrate-binding protein
MNRRELLARMGGAAARWPLPARAQLAQMEQPTRPLIGFLNNMSPEAWQPAITGFRQGLSEAGFTEDRNVAFVHRWTDGSRDLLPELAADLIRGGVALIVASADTPTALAAMAAAPHIPVVFLTEDDPVRFGLVASLERPGGRATGMFLTNLRFDASAASLQGKLRRSLLPDDRGTNLIIEIFDTSSVAMKTDPVAAFDSNLDAARFNNPRVIIAPPRFVTIACGPFLDKQRREQLVSLAARHRIPALYYWGVFAEEGGLISHGFSLADMYAQMGRYAGSILNGADPAEMPVLKPAKFEAILNRRTAAELGLDPPAQLLARVDKVIE